MSRVMPEPGTLWTRVVERTEHAIRCGALQPVPTEYEFVEQDGIRFLVRILPSLARKEEAKKQQQGDEREANPFLPYDEDLFVANASDTHVYLLNKYNVIDHHLLIVTRQFEEQESFLTLRDFEAMFLCMAEFEGLAFYNAGKTAGASQRHKHLQYVPLPLAPEGAEVPIEPAIAAAELHGPIGTSPRLPFAHAIARLEYLQEKPPAEAAEAALECYLAMLQTLGLRREESGSQQPGPYNLLATRQWMMLVPRSKEDFDSISVNSLGFAGALLVKDRGQLKVLKDYGPMTVLRKVTAHNETVNP